MRKPEHLPPQFQGRPFSVRVARAEGISASRVRAADLVMPFRGVRSSRLPRSLDERTLALEAVLGAAAFFSHTTAALIYGLPLPGVIERATVLHVSVAVPAFPPRRKGVTGHRLPASTHVRVHRGHRVVDPISAWLQLSTVLSARDLVVAGDGLVRRKHPLTTMAELADAVASLHRSKGSRASRAAFARIRARTDSPRETLVRLILVDAGLPEPVVGHQIIDEDGYFVATPDLVYVEEKIAIEYEGSLHQTDPKVYADDIERREAMEAANWLVIRVVKQHITSRQDWLVARVERALRERAVWGPPPR